MRLVTAASTVTGVLLRRGIIRAPATPTIHYVRPPVALHQGWHWELCTGPSQQRHHSTRRQQSTAQGAEQRETPDWKINLLYDSECPLCLHEVRFLTRRDKAGAIKMTDLADIGYSGGASGNGGVDYERGMRRIHAVTRDGTVLQGVAVFRRVYNEIGLGWVYAATAWPVVRTLVDALYEVWAALRLRLTGRPGLGAVMEERERRRALLAAAAEGRPACPVEASDGDQKGQQCK